MTKDIRVAPAVFPIASTAGVPVVFPAAAQVVQTSLDKLKNEEDYLLALHEKLLEARKGATDFISNYMITCYGLFGFLLLFAVGGITAFTIGGANVKLDQSYLPEYILIVVLLCYALVDFHLLQLSNIFRNIRRNSAALSSINPTARVVNIDDMHLYVTGLIGPILAVARSSTKRLIEAMTFVPANIKELVSVTVDARNNPSFQSIWRVIVQLRSIFLRIIVLSNITWKWPLWAFIVYFPLFATASVVGYIRYNEFLKHPPNGAGVEFLLSAFAAYFFDVVVFVAVVIIVFVTFYSYFVLSISYSLDLLIKLVDEFGNTIEDFRHRFRQLNDYQLRELLEKVRQW
jgi:hypothetical protein